MGDFGWVDGACGAGAVEAELVVYESGGCSEKKIEVPERCRTQWCRH